MPALPGALWTCPGTACGSWGLSRKAQPKGMTQGGERPSEKGRLEEVAFKLGLEVWGGGEAHACRRGHVRRGQGL